MTGALFQAQQGLYTPEIAAICGIDEAGRGPLAGPVYAAAVILPRALDIPGINDSKKLSEKQREAVFNMITDGALAFCVASAGVKEIDELNILNASMLAMRRAYDGLGVRPELVLLDGNVVRGFEGINARSVIGGDGIYACIAAASVLAKVSRDRYMLELSEQYPAYGFSRHKGYPTKAHIEILRSIGPCPEHRPGFIRKLLCSPRDSR